MESQTDITDTNKSESKSGHSPLLSFKTFFISIISAGVIGLIIFYLAYFHLTAHMYNPSLYSYCFEKTELSSPTWRTLIMSGSKKISDSPERIWNTWADISLWSTWSTPLHVSAQWNNEPGWKENNTFKQSLNLGLPFTLSSEERIRVVIDQRQAAWWKNEYGIKSCQVWSFIPTEDGKTIVNTTVVLHGVPIGILRPWVSQLWQSRIEESVVGLLNKVVSLSPAEKG